MNKPYSIFKPALWLAAKGRPRYLIRIAVTTMLCGSLPGNSLAADLWDVYSLALTNDPLYQAEILNHKASTLQLPIARTAFRPSISAEASVAEDHNSGALLRRSEDYEISLNANLPLYNKANRINIGQSRDRVGISELELRQAKQNLILRVADRYFNLLAAYDAGEVARLEKIAIQRQMDLASERLEVGLVTRTDLFDAKARFKQAEANEISARNNINNSIALLQQIIGTPPQALSPLGESAPLELPRPNDMDTWVGRALENNTILATYALDLKIRDTEIERQKSARLPVVSLNAGHRHTDARGGFASSGITRMLINVKLPLYSRGLINLRTRQAGLIYNQAESRLEQARRTVSTQATTAFLTMASRVSQVEALFEAITAGESALEAKTEGFNAGLTTNLDVLDAQRDLSRSRTDYLRARYDYILSVLELEQAVGDLNEEDIRRVNDWLQASPSS